mgnify:CR=1 FL=1
MQTKNNTGQDFVSSVQYVYSTLLNLRGLRIVALDLPTSH